MYRCLSILMISLVLFSQPSGVSAQIPNGSKAIAAWKKLRLARINRSGENPQRERPPLTKPLNDPSHLEEGTPEIIKKAAEVKMAEDAKVQKIKAVKYLTSIGCACYDLDDSITAALIEAAGDCTEEVRLTTVCSVMEAATSKKCANCGTGCCCKEALLMKLYAMAYERDDTGCYVEPSERVRAAAKQAMKACCPGTGPVETAEPDAAKDEKKPEEKETVPDDDDKETVPDDMDGDDTDADHTDADDKAADGMDRDGISDMDEPKIEEDPSADAPNSDDGDSGDGDSGDMPDPKNGLDGQEQEVLRRRSDALGHPIGQIKQNDVEYGVVIDLDRSLQIAHVHFRDQSLQFPKGAKLMAVVNREGHNYWVGPFVVYKSFAGSVHVTAPDELSWDEIQKGTPVVSTTTQALRSRSTRATAVGQSESHRPASVADSRYSAFVAPATRVQR